jgi:Ca2+-binding RTX toxin-like protein
MLRHIPLTDQPLSVLVGGELRDPDRYELSSSTIIFLDPDGRPEFVTGIFEVRYSHLVKGYDGLEVVRVGVEIGDNDRPGIWVIESDGSTNVIEGVVNEQAPWIDTYTVVLTKQPKVDVTIAVTPQPTRTTRAQLVTLTEQVEADLATLTFTTTNWNVPQTITIRAVDDWIADGGDTKVFAPRPHTVIGIQGPLFIDGMGGEGSLAGLTEPVLLPGDIFDPEDIGETNIKASTGEIIEVTQTTLTVATTDIEDYSNLIGWTVEITEGTDAAVGKFRLILGTEQQGDNTVLLLNDPWEFTSEELAALTKYAITSESHNFFVNEEERVDILTVFHEDSLADNTGYLTGYLTDSAKEGYENRIHGLGMGPDLSIGGEVQPGGITYGRIEVLVINLGLGDDEFVVDSTHKRDDFQTWTMLNTGNGNDIVTVTLDPADDGLFAVNTEGGDDEVRAFESSLPLVIFGWDGADIILGGSGDDIIFGDRGRVDYLDESDRVVTRLGHSPDTITGNVSGATETTLIDETGPFPVIDDGLKGLVVWINDGPGAGQSRVIVSNTDSQLTIDPDTPWTVLPTGDSKYRITGIPSDQTDGVLRDPRRVLTVDADIGGDDTIRGNGGQDVIIGGAAADTIDGDEGSDLIFGDNVRLDDIPGSGAAVNPRFRTLSDTTIYHDDASVQVNGQGQPGPVAAPIWADWSITLLNETPAANSFGDDYIAGGANDDTIFGQRGDDTIQGDGSVDGKLMGHPVFAMRGLDGSLVLMPSFEAATDGDDYIEGNSGDDVIFGNLGQDDIIGGSSNLFSLTDAGLRPDGSDIIFGGAGTDIYRNHPGGGTVNGHARDADMILGDNGNIFRLVDGASEYLEFSYDQSSQYENRGELRVIPQAAQLLDYTLGGPDYDAAGAASDIGAADEIHGESGDDFIYGMVGNDILFGDGQDDDLIGGYGHDWISGGTGDDGILGDDGRIYTSRNDTNDEQLYGIEGFKTSELNEFISTPGKIQQATINVEGRLKKTANLTPFNVDPAATQDLLFRARYADDIIYGGLGNDSIHAGSGDDAVSGAEALPAFYDYDHPSNPGNVLGFNPDTGEFADYNENDALSKVEGFLLNFEAVDQLGEKVNDGDDVLFGDLGNDWLVGGTNSDHLYGGYGNDLLNVDDNLDTNGGANNQPDPQLFADADIAYGGAGRDRLIANTGADRLIDWVGEFNSYIVPFSAFGVATISRNPLPALMDYLYDLSKSDGADQTLGSNAARNGEPFGELGVVRQRDDDWNDQTGPPDDPQPGNTGGTKKDVIRETSSGNKQKASINEATPSVQPAVLSVSVEPTNSILPLHIRRVSRGRWRRRFIYQQQDAGLTYPVQHFFFRMRLRAPWWRSYGIRGRR